VQTIPPIPTHFAVAWSVVCLSHTRPCLNSSTDLDAIWQVHLRGTMAHWRVRWGPCPQEKERFGGQAPSRNMQLQIAAKPSVLCCHLTNTNELCGLARAIPPFAKLLWSLSIYFPSAEWRRVYRNSVSCYKMYWTTTLHHELNSWLCW